MNWLVYEFLPEFDLLRVLLKKPISQQSLRPSRSAPVFVKYLIDFPVYLGIARDLDGRRHPRLFFWHNKKSENYNNPLESLNSKSAWEI